MFEAEKQLNKALRNPSVEGRSWGKAGGLVGGGLQALASRMVSACRSTSSPCFSSAVYEMITIVADFFELC